MKKITKMLIAVMISSVFAVIPRAAEAKIDVGNLLGALASSSIQRAQISRLVKYYENDGREEVFSVLKDSYAAKEDVPMNEMLGDIVERVSIGIARNDISIIDKPYNYLVVPDKNFNAFCTMGHNIAVNEGVFTFVNMNEDMVAAVVAHEMAHGQKQHPIKGVNRQLNALLGRNIVASQLDGFGSFLVLDIVSRHVINSGITKPNEWEADNVSYGYLLDAGYNPGAPAAVWQKIRETEGKKNRNVIKSMLMPSTHPSPKDRRDNLAQKMTEASGKAVTVSSDTGEIKIKDQVFMTPQKVGKDSAVVRSYLIAGNITALYLNGKQPGEATTEGNKMKVGDKVIIETVEGEPSAAELAAIFNNIK